MLRPIIPIIVYHGKDKWHHQSFENYFPTMEPELTSFFPSFDYLLTDLSRFSDEDLTQMPIGILHQALLLLKYTRNQKDIRPFFLEIFTSLEPYSQIHQYINLILSYSVYICGVGGIEKEVFIKLVQQLPANINKRVMTIYEQFIQEGEKIGQEQAKRQKENHVIKEGMEMGLAIENIARLAELTVEEVKSRMKELGLQQ